MKEDRSSCLFCKHFKVHTGRPEYSTLTPGIDMDILCVENIWRIEPLKDDEETFQQKMMVSRGCNKFEMRWLSDLEIYGVFERKL